MEIKYTAHSAHCHPKSLTECGCDIVAWLLNVANDTVCSLACCLLMTSHRVGGREEERETARGRERGQSGRERGRDKERKKEGKEERREEGNHEEKRTD